jgi:hypothetical protein
MPIHELIRHRDEITSHLPPVSLNEINVEEETLLQFHALRALQNQVLDDDSIPLNQRAQVANSVAASLGRLAELQQSLWTSERFKRIESLLIRCVSSLPTEVSAQFLSEYRSKIQEIASN